MIRRCNINTCMVFKFGLEYFVDSHENPLKVYNSFLPELLTHSSLIILYVLNLLNKSTVATLLSVSVVCLC